MSKILDITPISDSAKFPIKKGTLQFLQDSYKESISEILIGMIGRNNYDPSIAYVIQGALLNNTSGSTWHLGNGSIFYNYEIFQIKAGSVTVTGTLGLGIVTTQYTTYADPVILSDTSTVNVHNIRKMQLVDYAGTPDIALPVPIFPVKAITLQAGWTSVGGYNANVQTGDNKSALMNGALSYTFTGAGTLYIGDVDPYFIPAYSKAYIVNIWHSALYQVQITIYGYDNPTNQGKIKMNFVGFTGTGVVYLDGLTYSLFN